MANGVTENARNLGFKKDAAQLVVTQSPMAVVETKWMIVDVTDWNRIVSVTGRLPIAAKKLVVDANDHYMNLLI